MINHARTLIVNQSGANVVPGVLGAEFVEPDYRPYAMSQEMAVLHSAWFGLSPDSLYINQVARILIECAYACPDVAEYFSSLDSRTTHEFASYPIIAAPTVKIRALTQSSNELSLVGDAALDESRGRAYFMYTVFYGTDDIRVSDSVTGRVQEYPKREVGDKLGCGVTPIFSSDMQGAWEASVALPVTNGPARFLIMAEKNQANLEKMLRASSKRWYELHRYGHGPVHKLAAVLAAFVEAAEKKRHG